MHADAQYQALLTYVQMCHAGQVRAGDVPVWHHLVRVADLLEHALNQSGDGTPARRREIILAALGHDLLEDTVATKSEIMDRFGSGGLALIEGMTNRLGDDNPAPYVAQVAVADEAIRLTKLADLYDNYASAAYTLKLLGTEWARNYFLPIVDPMCEAIRESSFTYYAKSAGIIWPHVDLARDTFHREVGYLEAAA